jgi:heat shock protein HspQ
MKYYLFLLLFFAYVPSYAKSHQWVDSLKTQWDVAKGDPFYNKGSFIIREKNKKKGKEYLLIVSETNNKKKLSLKALTKKMCQKNKSKLRCIDEMIFTSKGAYFLTKSDDSQKVKLNMLFPAKMKKNVQKEHGKNLTQIARLIREVEK